MDYIIVYFNEQAEPSINETKDFAVYQLKDNKIRSYYGYHDDMSTSYKTEDSGWFPVAKSVRKYMTPITEEEMFLLCL